VAGETVEGTTASWYSKYRRNSSVGVSVDMLSEINEEEGS